MLSSIAHQVPQLGEIVAGRWSLARLIGRGGSGVVYEATDRLDGRSVAVKVLFGLRGREADTFAQRIARDAKLPALCQSRHVVAIRDTGVDEASGAPYLVMPLLEGQDLRTLMHQLGPLQPAVAARVVRQACAGLAEAHAAGLFHRDIKPSNLFLDYDPNGDVVVRLLDFGMAHYERSDTELTQGSASLGTTGHLAPERRADPTRADAQSDVYSLGSALYAALSDAPPLSKLDDDELVTPLQERAPWLDPSFAAVVHGCLVAEPLDRCPSADALARALEPYTGGTDRLDYRMFVPLTTALRSLRAARVEMPARWLGTANPTQAVDVTLSVSDSLAGATIATRYALRRRLGAGGMGWVYEAVGELGVRVAVKVIHAKEVADPQARKRFVREARTAAAVTSPHVVRVIDAGEDPQRSLPYLVMELLCGQDLSGLVREVGPLEPQTAARIFVQVCRGLAAVHASGLVHRDVKPGNLFLHQLPSGEVVVKICDFGIAKQIACDGEDGATQEILTRSDSILGSPAYMSPEQIKSSMTLDPRADVWSLGASLYQALVGAPPWSGRGEMGEVMFAIFTEDIEPRSAKTPWIPRGLAQVVQRAMCRSLTDRFQSVSEIEQALLPFTGGSTTVNAAELVGVPACMRTAAADDAAVVSFTTIDASPATLQAPDPALPGPKPRRRVGLALAVAAVFVVLAAVAVRSGAPPAVVPAPDSRAAAAPATTPGFDMPSSDALPSAPASPSPSASPSASPRASPSASTSAGPSASPSPSASATTAQAAAAKDLGPRATSTARVKATDTTQATPLARPAPAAPTAQPKGFAPAPFQ